MLKRTGILALIAFAFSASTLAQYSQPVRDVENPGHFPFFGSATLEQTPGGSHGTYGQLVATVPAGKRVVLEYAAVSCNTASNDSIMELVLQIPRVSNGVSSTIPFPLQVSRQGDAYGGRQRWVGAGPLKLYADSTPSFNIAFGFLRSNNAGETSCRIFVTGFTISVP